MFSKENIKDAICKLSRGKAPGFDNLCNEFFVHGLNTNLVTILLYFYNLASSYGYLPDDFNTSLVTPIPKKGLVVTPSDFRPISVSSGFCTIFESILLLKMECFG